MMISGLLSEESSKPLPHSSLGGKSCKILWQKLIFAAVAFQGVYPKVQRECVICSVPPPELVLISHFYELQSQTKNEEPSPGAVSCLLGACRRDLALMYVNNELIM